MGGDDEPQQDKTAVETTKTTATVLLNGAKDAVDIIKMNEKKLEVDCRREGNKGYDLENENSASFSETSPRRLTSRSNTTQSVPLSLIEEKSNTPHQLMGCSPNSKGSSAAKMFFPPGKSILTLQPSTGEGTPRSSTYEQDKRELRSSSPVYARSFPSVGLLSMASTLSEDSILHEQPGQVPSDEMEDEEDSMTVAESLAPGPDASYCKIPFPSVGNGDQAELREVTGSFAEEEEGATSVIVGSWNHNDKVNGIFRSRDDQDEDENTSGKREGLRSSHSQDNSRTSRNSKGGSKGRVSRSRFMASLKSGLGAVFLRSNPHDASPSPSSRNNTKTPPLVPKRERPPSRSRCQNLPPTTVTPAITTALSEPTNTALLAGLSPVVATTRSNGNVAVEHATKNAAATCHRGNFEYDLLSPAFIEETGTKPISTELPEPQTSSVSPLVVNPEEAASSDAVEAEEESSNDSSLKSGLLLSPTVVSHDPHAVPKENDVELHSDSSIDEGPHCIDVPNRKEGPRSKDGSSLLGTKLEITSNTIHATIPFDQEAGLGDRSPTLQDSSVDVLRHPEEHPKHGPNQYKRIIACAATAPQPLLKSVTVLPKHEESTPQDNDSSTVAKRKEERETPCQVKTNYDWAYRLWIKKGLLSEDIMKGKAASTKPFIDEELDVKLRKRRESLDAQMATTTKNKRRTRQSLPSQPVSLNARLPADDHRTRGKNFANVLSQWKTKTDGGLPAEETIDETVARSQQPLKSLTYPTNNVKAPIVEQTQKPSKIETTKIAASSKPIPHVLSDRTISPIRAAPRSQAWKLKKESEKIENVRRLRRSVPAPRGSLSKGSRGGTPSSTANSTKEVRAQSVPKSTQEHINGGSSSNGRPPSTGQGSRSSRFSDQDRTATKDWSNSLGRASNGEDSTKHMDKYVPRAQSLPRTRCSSPRPGGVPGSISITTPTKAPWSNPGSSSGTASNVPPQSLPEASMLGPTDFALMGRADKQGTKKENCPQEQSCDGSSMANSIPKEVRLSSKKKKKPASGKKNNGNVLSPYALKVVRSLEKVYNDTEEIRSPQENNFAERPWRRDKLISQVHPDRSTKETGSDCDCRCVCSDSVFSGNDVMIDFFLPLMGAACTCGKKPPGLVLPEEPTSLVNILRPWQVGFLSSCGIYRGDELVKAHHRNTNSLATAMRNYRKQRGMTPFRTKSCGMALQIWSKTSKAFVRSIRSQMKAAESCVDNGVQLERARELRLPNALYIVSAFLDNMPSDCISQGPGLTHCTSDSGTSVASSISVSTYDISDHKNNASQSLIMRGNRCCEAEI